jgi:hypothetical protein
MSSDDTHPVSRFYLQCPSCGGNGTRYRPRIGTTPTWRDGAPRLTTATGNVPEDCSDCDDTGRIEHGNGEWRGRPTPTES